MRTKTLDRICTLAAFSVWVGVSVFAVLMTGHIAGSCRSSVPIVVKQVNYQCSNIIDNGDGTVTLEQCREDGRIENQGGPGGAGDDSLDILEKDPDSRVDQWKHTREWFAAYERKVGLN